VAASERAVRRGRRRGAWLVAGLMILLGVLAGCQSAGGSESAAASRIAHQIADAPPLYIRGEYRRANVANEAWIDTLPTSAASMGLPADAGCDYLHTWLQLHGGMDTGWSYITILLRARRKVAVVVTAAESVVLQRSPTPRAPYTLTCVPASQSWVDQEEELDWPNSFPGFKLDDNHYLASPLEIGQDQPGAVSFKMEPGAEQYFLYTGYSSRCTCKWGVELYFAINGSPEHVLVENGDQPFQTAPALAYPDDSAHNAVWCAITDRPRLVAPAAADCPPPTTYEGRPVY
jgi:hypothetical protein